MKPARWLAYALVIYAAAVSCRRAPAPIPAPPGEAPRGLFKEANVAGKFYPAGKDELAAAVQSRLAAAPAKLAADKVVAVFVPHAGYDYSAGVAAVAYRQVEGRKPATVVLLGPSHHYALDEIAAATYDGFETPLGTVDMDNDFAAAVEKGCADVRRDNLPFAEEHGIEVQLPFVQTLFPGARVAPFIFCTHDAASAERFGKALAAAVAVRKDDVLVVATCDLSHYHPYDEAEKLDGAYVKTFERFDPAAVFAEGEKGEFEIDAPGPVAAAMWAARELGATKAVALEYKNSGDVTGDKSAGVVGYFAGALVKP